MRNKKTWSEKIIKVPGIGVIVEIASDYVCEGAFDHFGKIPPLRYWVNSLGWPIVLSLCLALLPLPCDCITSPVKIDAKAFDVAFAIIPSLLGFGIGAYALVFGLGSEILRKIQDAHLAHASKSGKPPASVLHINSVFAFPLLLMAVTLFLASLQKIFPAYVSLSTMTWFLTFFSISLTFQLVSSLYRLGQVIILEKLSEESKTKSP